MWLNNHDVDFSSKSADFDDKSTGVLLWLSKSVDYQMTDSQISDLLRVNERWLALNEINVRPISTVKLTDTEVDSLIAWQKNGIEVSTRKELFCMLWWYSEEGELVLLAKRLKIEEFLNNYFAENWIVTANFDDYVDRDRDQEDSAYYSFYKNLMKTIKIGLFKCGNHVITSRENIYSSLNVLRFF